MSQEEKAKAYDEMTRLLSNWYKSETDIGIKDHISAIYPEIAESEDEKIRKWLINLVKNHIKWLENKIREQLSNGQIYGGELDKAQASLAWLEKKEDKPLTLQDLSPFKTQVKGYLLEEGWPEADSIYLNQAAVNKTKQELSLIPNHAKGSEKEEKPLKIVGKGDIVAFYQEWKGEKKRGIMLVKSYDYGNGDMTVSEEHPYGASAPRCIWGLHCTGTWYGDWAPSTHEFFEATEEEKQLLIDKMPNDVKARAIELNLIPKTRKEAEQKSVDSPQDLSPFKAQLKEYLLEEGWSKADPIYLDEAVDYKTESLLALIPGTAHWNEEDETNLQHIIKILKEQAYADYDVDEDGELCGFYRHLSNWLQSLRSQRLKEK